MADSPIRDAITKVEIPTLPAEEVRLAIEATEHDLGASLTANKDIGKQGGWFVGAEGGWWKSTGGRIRAWLGWNGS